MMNGRDILDGRTAVAATTADRIQALEEENVLLRRRVLELEEQAIRQELDNENRKFSDASGKTGHDEDNDAHHTRRLQQSSGSSYSSTEVNQGKTSVVDDALSLNQQPLPPRKSFPTFDSVLTPGQIERYSRQLLLSNGFGVEGQRMLLSSRVLIIGAGGIGSTVIMYLAACGVGSLTIMDFDSIEISNLHRQIIHKSSCVGMNKARSAQRAVYDLNPSIVCTAVEDPLLPSNALEIISKHDVVVDASDNPQTRYLINDACVLADKPLVSGSAIGMEGQLTVYNYKLSPVNQTADENDSSKIQSSSDEQQHIGVATKEASVGSSSISHSEKDFKNRGPCYRCLYPTPNVSEGSKSCSDNGVLGPVPGLIGILQAVETMKVLTCQTDNALYDRLLMYDATQCSFLRIKKPPRRPNCAVCGTNPSITSMDESFDACYAARGPSCASKIAEAELSDQSWDVTCQQYNSIRQSNEPHVLLDVRVKEQFDLCSLPGSVNIPLEYLAERIDDVIELSTTKTTTNDGKDKTDHQPIYCLCRRGVASVAATNLLNENLSDRGLVIRNIHGGLDNWRLQIDESFPKY